MATRSQPLLVAASVTDVGRVRDHNEDAFFVDAERGLFIVSDGMGGQNAGELASRMVVSVLPQMIEGRLRRLSGSRTRAIRYWLRREIVNLSQQLRTASAGEVGFKGMGATLVLALFGPERVHIAHMGDSRAYLFRERRLTQLTQDHSVVGILLRNGEITPEEAKSHPAGGQLSRYVGMAGEVYPDILSVPLQKGDRLLLCTDGLTGMVPHVEIAALLRERADPQQTCQTLVDAANRAGGKDNVTVVVVNVG